MLLNYSCKLRYIILFLSFLPFIGSANHIPEINGTIILSLKSESSDKLCNEHFYINNLDIVLASDGTLSVSLEQFSKAKKGFITHLTIDLVDYKGRTLTTYNTPTLQLEDSEEKKISKNFYFTENFKYQFSAEEFKIFMDNVKKIKVTYNGCNEPNLVSERDRLTRSLPKEIVEEFIHKAPLVSE